MEKSIFISLIFFLTLSQSASCYSDDTTENPLTYETTTVVKPSRPIPIISINDASVNLNILPNGIFIAQFIQYILTGSYGNEPVDNSLFDNTTLHTLIDVAFLTGMAEWQNSGPDPQTFLDVLQDLENIIERLKTNGTDSVYLGEIRKYLTPTLIKNALLFYLYTQKDNYANRFDDYLETEFLGNLTGACKSHAKSWFYDIVAGNISQNIWAFQMLDAAAKLPSGVLNGDINWVGSFKQCNKIRDKRKNPQIEGKYCRAKIKFPLEVFGGLDNIPIPEDIGFNYGLCISKECSNDQVAIIVANSLKLFTVFKTLSVAEVNCSENDVEKPTSTKALIVVLSILVGWILLSTVIDIIYQIKETFIGISQTEITDVDINEIIKAKEAITGSNVINNGKKVVKKKGQRSKLLAFIMNCSFYSNALNFFRTDNGGKITCLNGIRLFSMIWIVWGHTYNYLVDRTNFFLLDNLLDLAELNEELYAQLIINAMYGVDTFFLMSAFLVTTSLMNKLEKSKRITLPEWIYYYVHRYWRLAPPFLITIIIYNFIMPYMNSGPLWTIKNFPPRNDECKKNLWSYALFINNFYPNGKGAKCMGYLWYIPNDYQFYALSPLFVLTLYKFPKAGITLILFSLSSSILALAFLVSNVYVTRKKNIVLVLVDIWEDVYIKPYCRATPWLAGILLGYAFFKIKKIKINSFAVAIGWILSTVFALTAVFGGFTNHAKNARRMETGEYALYFSLSRVIWAMSISWIIFACHYGYGGPINQFLSIKSFIPLTRLSYCAYLIHPTIMNFYNYSQEKLFHATGITLVYIAIGHISITFILSFFFTLLFEVPFIAIEKLVYPGRH